MARSALDACGDLQQLRLSRGSERHQVGDLRTSVGQGPGLVKGDMGNLGRGLDYRAALHQHSPARAG